MPQHDGLLPAVDWFAVQVRAGRERLVAVHLRSRGYDVFLPQHRERRHWSDRVKYVERPLFPGYLFCRIYGDIFGKIVTAPHVLRLVGDGERPLPVEQNEIEAIQRVVDVGLDLEPWPMPKVGQRVRIVFGPLVGTEGTVVRTKSGQRLIVSIGLLQRAVAVELHADWVSESLGDGVSSAAQLLPSYTAADIAYTA
jgi:transcription termination/antitermination protein NusG